MGLLRSTETKHRYQTCQDDECELPHCRICKEGFEAGHAAGYASGYADGRADGYAEGYADGHADAAK
jgi:flagellar biosynthesis/type III secretory pathway protein FliH